METLELKEQHPQKLLEKLNQLEKHVDFLEASNKSFASTFWQLYDCLKNVAIDIKSVGEDMLSVSEKAERPIHFSSAADKIHKIGCCIEGTLTKIDRDWLGDGDEQI